MESGNQYEILKKHGSIYFGLVWFWIATLKLNTVLPQGLNYFMGWWLLQSEKKSWSDKEAGASNQLREIFGGGGLSGMLLAIFAGCISCTKILIFCILDLVYSF